MCSEVGLVPVKRGRKPELGVKNDNPASLARRRNMAAFLRTYKETGLFIESCRQNGLKPSTVTRWTKDPVFAAAYEEAQTIRVNMLEDAAFKRSMEGVKKSVVSAGKQFESDTVYPDQLTMFLLRANNPRKFQDGRRTIGAEMGQKEDGTKYFKVYDGFDPNDV